MAINFPATPTVGQLHPDPAQAGVPQYKWDGTAWLANTPPDALAYVRRAGDTMTGPLALAADPTVALQAAPKQYVDARDARFDTRRNRVINGAMQLSQENGNANGTSSGYYPADQWSLSINTSGTFAIARVAIPSLYGSRNRIRFVVTAPDTVVDSGDYALIFQYIEGINVADFGWGSTSAKQVILRFGFTGPAGTYSFALVNGTNYTRSYVMNFTITGAQANTFTEQTFVIPGDQTGVWSVESTVGISLFFTLVAGSTWLAPATGWNSGYVLKTAANSNGMGTVNNTFDIYDVGLYVDSDNSGIPPKWEEPDVLAELARCERYYQISTIGGDFTATTINQYFALVIPFHTAMRAAPTLAFFPYSTSNAGAPGLVQATSNGATGVFGSSAPGRAHWYGDVIMRARM